MLPPTVAGVGPEIEAGPLDRLPHHEGARPVWSAHRQIGGEGHPDHVRSCDKRQRYSIFHGNPPTAIQGHPSPIAAFDGDRFVTAQPKESRHPNTKRAIKVLARSESAPASGSGGRKATTVRLAGASPPLGRHVSAGGN